jgi:hypothetical protein
MIDDWPGLRGAQSVGSIGDANDEGEQPSKRQARRIIDLANPGPAAVAPNGHDFVHHDLRRFAKAGRVAGGERHPVKRRGPRRACQQAYKNAVRSREKVRLDDQRWPGFAVVATQGNRDEVASPHVSASSASAAASMKSSASRSSGAFRSSIA